MAPRAFLGRSSCIVGAAPDAQARTAPGSLARDVCEGAPACGGERACARGLCPAAAPLTRTSADTFRAPPSGAWAPQPPRSVTGATLGYVGGVSAVRRDRLQTCLLPSVPHSHSRACALGAASRFCGIYALRLMLHRLGLKP